MRSYSLYQNLGQIDHNLHNHVFDDVICKPPTVIEYSFVFFLKCLLLAI